MYLLTSFPLRSGRLDIRYRYHVVSGVRGGVSIIGPCLHVVHDEVRFVVGDFRQLLSTRGFVAVRVLCTVIDPRSEYICGQQEDRQQQCFRFEHVGRYPSYD